MKYLRILAIALCCVMLLGMLIACKDEDTVNNDTDTEVETTTESTSDTESETTDTEASEPENKDPEESQPPYTGPAIRNETWNTGDITPGNSNVSLGVGENDPTVDWN